MSILSIVTSESTLCLISNSSPGVMLLQSISLSPNFLAHEHSYENGQAHPVRTLTLALLVTIKTNKAPRSRSDLIFTTTDYFPN